MQTKKVNLPLPRETHAAIFTEARRREVPATRLVRTIVEGWLREQRRLRRAEEIRRFAEQHAGSELDLLPDVEEAAADAYGSRPSVRGKTVANPVASSSAKWSA